MEPIKINVNVEVGLKQETLEALAVIFNPLRGCTCVGLEEPSEPEQKAAPAPVEDDDDLPPNDAPDPAPKKVPTEAEMRAEIQKTRKRGVPTKTIRDYIKDTFGVEASVDCPPEKRQALIDGLANLAA